MRCLLRLLSLALPCAVLALPGLASATLAPATDPGDYVVIALDKAELRDRAFVTGGHIAVNEPDGRLELRRFVSMHDGTAVVAEQPSIGTGTSLFDLFANDLGLIDPTATVRATVAPVSLPLLVVPTLPVFAPGTDAVRVERDETVVLPPGAYGTVFVNRRGILILSGGTYEMASLRTNKLTKVFVEGPSTVNIAGKLSIGHLAGFGPSVDGVTAEDVEVNVGGRSVRFGPATHVAADVLAPHARIRAGRSFHGRGRLIGRQVIADRTVNLRRGVTTMFVEAPPPGPRGLAGFCTLTAQTFGAADGDANGVGGAVTTHPGILPVQVGMPGVGALTVADQSALVCLLPTTGVDGALCTGLDPCPAEHTIDACANPPILDFDAGGDGSSGGLGAGPLLGELVAAKLNVALSDLGATPGGLGAWLLPEMLCTTKCPEGRELDPSKMGQQAAAAGIADGINTFGDLLAIGDQALGTPCTGRTCAITRQAAFAPPNPIARSSITTALSTIHECFEGCATIIPCNP